METVKELELKIKKLKLELNKAKREEKIWKPKTGEKFYYIVGDGSVFCDIYTEQKEFNNINMFAMGNVFKTVEDAQFAMTKLQIIKALRDFATLHNDQELVFDIDEDYDILKQTAYKYYLVFRYDSKKIDYFVNDSAFIDNNIYFSSKEIAKKAVEEIGEKMIKKYYFGIDE